MVRSFVTGTGSGLEAERGAQLDPGRGSGLRAINQRQPNHSVGQRAPTCHFACFGFLEVSVEKAQGQAAYLVVSWYGGFDEESAAIGEIIWRARK
jgi:hypothetical protein